MNPFNIAFKKSNIDDTSPEAQKLQLISNRYGQDFYNTLSNLFEHLTGEALDLKKTSNMIKILNVLQKKQKKNYIKALLFPEKVKIARVPCKFPVPSNVIQQTDYLIVTTNSLGNYQIEFNPQNFLSSTGTEVYLNTNASLDGNSILSTVTYTTPTVLTNSFATSGNFSCFRLVSACMIIQYVGSLQDQRGRFGGALEFTATSTSDPVQNNFSAFNNIDDKMFSQVVVTTEGLKICYFPKDYQDFNFIKVQTNPEANKLSSKVTLLSYGQGLPAGSPCVRIDFIKNIECIPNVGLAELLETNMELEEEDRCAENCSAFIAQHKLSVLPLTTSNALAKAFELPGEDYLDLLDFSQENGGLNPKLINSVLPVLKDKNDYIPRDILIGPAEEIELV